MDDVGFGRIQTGTDDFLSNGGYLSLGKRNSGFEITALTILINHKDFLFPDENLFEIYDIFVLERGEYFNFIEEKLLKFRIFFHFVGGNDLNGIFYIWISLDGGLIDFTILSLSNECVDIVLEIRIGLLNADLLGCGF